MSAPVIGISTYCEQARWGAWDQRVSLISQNYVDQVVAAGGVPVLLPPVAGIEAALGRLDGLVITGGPDIEPARYGAEPGPRTTVLRPERDAAEAALFRGARDAGLPVLGICRGMQLINVELGGSLTQHLPDVVGHEGHSPTPGAMAEHKVTVGPATRLAGILGDGTRTVPTHHHQGVRRLGTGLVATAWAEDGTVEAVELDGPAELGGTGGAAWFMVAVQWHPEAGDDPSLFLALAAAARAHAVG